MRQIQKVQVLFFGPALIGGDAGDLGDGDAEALGDGSQGRAGSASAADGLDLGISEAGLVVGGATSGRRPAGEAHQIFPLAVTTAPWLVR